MPRSPSQEVCGWHIHADIFIQGVCAYERGSQRRRSVLQRDQFEVFNNFYCRWQQRHLTINLKNLVHMMTGQWMGVQTLVVGRHVTQVIWSKQVSGHIKREQKGFWAQPSGRRPRADPGLAAGSQLESSGGWWRKNSNIRHSPMRNRESVLPIFYQKLHFTFKFRSISLQEVEVSATLNCKCTSKSWSRVSCPSKY